MSKKQGHDPLPTAGKKGRSKQLLEQPSAASEHLRDILPEAAALTSIEGARLPLRHPTLEDE